MFHKNTEKLEALIGCNSRFQGDIETKGTLRVDGSVEGNINADWVIIGEKANVRGDVNARGIIVGGRVEGTVRAKEIVEIKGKGQLVGDIFTGKLTISEGAIFDGRSSMNKKDSNIIEFVQQGKA